MSGRHAAGSEAFSDKAARLEDIRNVFRVHLQKPGATKVETKWFDIPIKKEDDDAVAPLRFAHDSSET